MSKYISNAFSPNMISVGNQAKIMEISRARARMFVAQEQFFSVIGHDDVASLISSELNFKFQKNRATLIMDNGDFLIVGQYSGPRLPELCASLPEGSNLRWFIVHVIEDKLSGGVFNIVTNNSVEKCAA